MGLFDRTGAVVVEYTYDAWGNILSTTGSLVSTVGVENPYRYRGYRYDNETGWYYLQSRYYNPVWGRFINADDSGYAGANMFLYCSNNPIIKVDPTGYYDRDKAYAYAQKWYGRRNLAFFHYGTTDCINFDSQCLNAGGISMDSKWHSYKGKYDPHGVGYANYLKGLIDPQYWYHWDITDTWSLVAPAVNYWKNSSLVSNVREFRSVEDIHNAAKYGWAKKGDIAFLATHYDNVLLHAIFINRVSSSDIMYTAHTRDTWDCSVINQYFKNVPSGKQCLMLVCNMK